MPDANIANIFKEKAGPLLSYEFFPPKTEKGYANLTNVIDVLGDTAPDFVTVTYGAGGSTQTKTLEVCATLKQADFGPVMPHLTCVGSTRDELEEIAHKIYDAGYRNIMTLRGDPPGGEAEFVPPADGLGNARDLVRLLRSLYDDFCCGVAGYPETHPEAISVDDEMAYLKEKVDAGASFITTQLFFDNDHYYRFVDRCTSVGIEVPILPGVLPASSLKQLTRFTSLCGASLPHDLQAQLEAAGGEGDTVIEIGIEWCVAQIEDLLASGAPGIHLYILNQARPALQRRHVQVFQHYLG